MAGILAMTFLFSTVAPGATLEVGSGKTYATIQAAVNAATTGTIVYTNRDQDTAGDTITVYAGTYAGFNLDTMDVITIQAYQTPLNCTATSERVTINSGITLTGWCEGNTIDGFYLTSTSTYTIYARSYNRLNTWKNMVIYDGNATGYAYFGQNNWGTERFEYCTLYNNHYPFYCLAHSSVQVHDSVVAFNDKKCYSSPDNSSTYYTDWYNNPDPNTGYPSGTVSNCLNVDPKFKSTTSTDDQYLWLDTGSPCIDAAEDSSSNMGALNDLGAAAPQTLEVGSGKTYATIQAAVNAASSSDTVLVYAGTYSGFTVTGNDMDSITIQAYQNPDACTVVAERVVINSTITFDEWAENNIIQGFYVSTTSGDSITSGSYCRGNSYKNMVIYGNTDNDAFSGVNMNGADYLDNCTIYDCDYGGNYGTSSGAVVHDSIVTECDHTWTSTGTSDSSYSDWYQNPSTAGYPGGTVTDCLNADPKFVSTTSTDVQFLWLYEGSPCIAAAEDSTANMGALAEVATITVGIGKDYETIQAAVNNASANDTIVVYAGTYDGFTVSGNSMDNLTIKADTLPENCSNVSDRATIITPITFTNWAENNTIQGFYLNTPGLVSAYSTNVARGNTWKNMVVYGNSSAAFYGTNQYGSDVIDECTIFNCGTATSYGYASGYLMYDTIVAYCRNACVGTGTASYCNFYDNPDPNDGRSSTVSNCTYADPCFYSTSIKNQSFLCLLTGSSDCINAASDSTNMGALGSANSGVADWPGADNLSFTKNGSNPVLSPSASGSDAGYVNHACVRIATTGTYMMWYTGAPSVGGYPRRIHLATSADGESWTKHGFVLSNGNSASWECYSVHMGTVLWDSSASLWKMWYVGHGNGTGSSPFDGWQEIGYATSPGGTTWTKSGSNPIFQATENEVDFDRNTCRAPAVLYDESDSLYKMWYYGTKNNSEHYGPTGYAESSDGVAWTRICQINDNDDQYVCPDVLLINGNYHMFHDIGAYTGYAFSRNGMDWDDYYLNDLIPKGPSVSDWDHMYNQAATVVYDSDNDELDLWYNGIKSYAENVERIGLATTSFYPPAAYEPNSITIFEDDFEGGNLNKWDAHTGWAISGTRYVSASNSVQGDSDALALTSDTLDTSSYTSMTVSFKYYIEDIDAGDNIFVYFKSDSGTQVIMEEFGEDVEDTWLTFSKTVNSVDDAIYFHSGFFFRINGGSIDNAEYLYVDDVKIVCED